ncbi:hypothetical protein [Paraburkholderia youngii]|uniref:hypothetical protein n=1 Tax=Paraburkholderia youngii TaxID=2782701 RepID=UPI003D229BC9
MKDITIAEGWQEFAANVIPLSAPPAQYTDMRTAYYAGAIQILETCAKIAESVDETTGVVMLERLHEEKREFLREMKRRQGNIQGGMQ